MSRLRVIVLAGVIGVAPGLAQGIALADPPPGSPEAQQEAKKLDALPPVKPPSAVHVDHSGRKEEGRASFYSRGFVDKKMADGRRMDPCCEPSTPGCVPCRRATPTLEGSRGHA